jgi:hypothetical protein
MIHLFNEVFVEQDSKITIYPVFPNAQVQENLYVVAVISEVYNTSDLQANPACLYSANNLNALYQQHGWEGIEDFLKVLMVLNRKIIIYADNNAMSVIAATVFKSLTNMEQAQLDTYISIYKYRCYTSSKHYGDLYEKISMEFASSPAIDFSNFDFVPSFEFCLASAFYDINFSHKDKLIYLLSKFIKREYEDIILEVRKHIDSFIMHHHLQEALGATEYVTHIDINTIKTQMPRLAIYREPFYVEELYVPGHKAYRPGSFARGECKLNIALCTPEELAELISVTEDMVYLLTENEELTKEQVVAMFEGSNWKYINSVSSGTYLLTEAEYVDAVNDMINERTSIGHSPLDLRESILLPLISYFISLKNRNLLDELQKFTIK